MIKASILLAVWALFFYVLPIRAQLLLPEQKGANDALQSQLSQDGKDCLDARNNRDDNFCITEVASQTEKDFSIFYGNLKEILARNPANENNLADAQAKWSEYRDATCLAIDAFYRQGTARVGMVARCQIELTRSRMKDLDAIYYIPLHH